MNKKTNNNNYNKPFPKRLRALLKNENGISPLEREVTQTELAQALMANGTSVTRQTISLYANGETTPDIDKFKFIADFFNVSYDYLLGQTKSRDRGFINTSALTGLSDAAIIFLATLNKKVSETLDDSDVDYENKLNRIKIYRNYQLMINLLLTKENFSRLSNPINAHIEAVKSISKKYNMDPNTILNSNKWANIPDDEDTSLLKFTEWHLQEQLRILSASIVAQIINYNHEFDIND